MNPIDTGADDTGGANPSSADTPTIEDVQKLLAEGKDLPPGWSLTPNGRLVPPGWRINLAGILLPDLNREKLEEEVAKLKDELKSKRASLKHVKKRQQLLIDAAGDDKQKAAEAVAVITKHEAEVNEIEVKLRETREILLDLPPEVVPDEEQPWFEKIYANCNGYLVKDVYGNFKQTNETNTGRVLREMEISDRRDTETSSPLDRAFTALHDRHHVDHWGPLAGYRPGIIQHGGKKVLITKGAELIKPVEGEFPTIRELIYGMFQEQAIHAHCWNHLAAVPLYNGEITRGQILVLAGPINSGKSVYQNLIVTPMLGGRVARPYAFMVKRTDFNEDWFESEHLMCEDETPPRDYETQQLFAAELKKFAADENHWCHGKGKKAITLPPFWRVTVSVNDSSENMRSIPANDETLKDKMHVLKVYPEATVKLVESLGGQKNFANKIREELPGYLYWLLYKFQILAELKDTRFGMKAYQNDEILEAIEETAPHMLLLELLEVKYPGANKLEKSVLEIATDLQTVDTPRGVVPQSPLTLGRYMTTLSKISDAIEKKVTNKKNVYLLTFPEKGAKK
jgi:hypothetical protein